MQQADVARDGEPDKPLTRAGFGAHLALLLATLRHSPQRRALLALASGLVIVVAATAAGQIRLNVWTRAFYDALANKDVGGFGSAAAVFRGHRWRPPDPERRPDLAEPDDEMKLREGLTRDLIEQWLTPKRAFLLAGAGDDRRQSGPAHP